MAERLPGMHKTSDLIPSTSRWLYTQSWGWWRFGLICISQSYSYSKDGVAVCPHETQHGHLRSVVQVFSTWSVASQAPWTQHPYPTVSLLLTISLFAMLLVLEALNAWLFGCSCCFCSSFKTLRWAQTWKEDRSSVMKDSVSLEQAGSPLW